MTLYRIEKQRHRLWILTDKGWVETIIDPAVIMSSKFDPVLLGQDKIFKYIVTND